MTEWLDHFNLWLTASVTVLLALTIFVRFVENSYRLEFEKPLASLRDQIPSVLVTLCIFVVYAWLSEKRVIAANLVCAAIAAAALRGVWRIDRLLLVIPDRLQLLGTLGGVLYVIVLVASGESVRSVLFETGFGLAMVLLLWSLSAVYLKVRGNIGFGLGDIKLLAWLSLFFGRRMSDLILWSIALGVLTLVVAAARASIQQRKLVLPGAQDAFAFGPSIVGAAALEVMVHYG